MKVISAYQLLLDVINTKKLSKEDILNKIDVFFIAGRINQEEYTALIEKVKEVYGE